MSRVPSELMSVITSLPEPAAPPVADSAPSFDDHLQRAQRQDQSSPQSDLRPQRDERPSEDPEPTPEATAPAVEHAETKDDSPADTVSAEETATENPTDNEDDAQAVATEQSPAVAAVVAAQLNPVCAPLDLELSPLAPETAAANSVPAGTHVETSGAPPADEHSVPPDEALAITGEEASGPSGANHVATRGLISRIDTLQMEHAPTVQPGTTDQGEGAEHVPTEAATNNGRKRDSKSSSDSETRVKTLAAAELLLQSVSNAGTSGPQEAEPASPIHSDSRSENPTHEAAPEVPTTKADGANRPAARIG